MCQGAGVADSERVSDGASELHGAPQLGLVLADVLLPGLDGALVTHPDLLRHLRSDRPTLEFQPENFLSDTLVLLLTLTAPSSTGKLIQKARLESASVTTASTGLG